MKLRVSRRNFLRGVGIGAAAVALPFARVLSGKADDTIPKRFIAWFTPNGTIDEEWVTGGGATDFTLGRILEPLAPFRDKLLLLDGLNVRNCATGPGSGHQKGAGCFLTGRPLLDGDFGGGGGATSGWASGISLDQYIANEIAPPTAFPSLELGVYVRGSNNRHRLAYRGSNDPLPPQNSPYAVFDRLFADTAGGDAAAIERLRLRRMSVLDSVNGDLAELRGRLPNEHRLRLEAHLESLREVERRVESASLGGAVCEQPELGTPLDPERNENYPTMGQLQMDMLVAALACDKTRISTLMWSGSTSNQTFSFIDGVGSQGHHDMSHEANSSGTAKEQLVRINRWYSEQFAYLLGALDAIPEGDGTMLDNTLILWGNELSDGDSHNLREHKWVLAGNAAGYFRTGRYVQTGDVPHNNLLVSIANAMGVATDTFGAPEHCTGSLDGLT